MADYSETLKIIKKAAVDAVRASKPTELLYGEIIEETPLKCQVTQKLILEKDDLLLSTLVQDFTIKMAVEHETEEQSGGTGEESFASHKHEYKGEKSFKLQLGLKKGEKVILLRFQGGQKYLILDRVRGDEE